MADNMSLSRRLRRSWRGLQGLLCPNASKTQRERRWRQADGNATRAVVTATAAATVAAAAAAVPGMRAAAEGLAPPAGRAVEAGHGAAAGAGGPDRPAAAADGDDWTSSADDGDGWASADGDGG